VKIGLSFIFGNVDGFMPRFLDSFQKLTPHMYGVRAIGAQSPDGSWGICEAHGVKLAEYKNQPDAADWEHLDDFSAARNQAADMAAADGCDWILWADTDDILEEKDRLLLLKLLEKQSEKVDFWLLAYALTNNGLRLPRERVWRPGKARWKDPIHENCDPAEGTRLAQCLDIAITHKPDLPKKSPPDRNLKIIDARISKPLEGKWAFYRAQELIGLGRKPEAIQACLEAVKMPDLTPAERYELLINLSGLTDDLQIRGEYLGAAYLVDPARREALACLAATCMDLGRHEHALAYARSFMALPVPKEKAWTHRGLIYGWAGNLIYFQTLRLNGLAEQADREERKHFEEHGAKISLIHPTWANPFAAASIRKLWLERAKNADAIEHIFGLASDDVDSLNILRRFRHSVAKEGGGFDCMPQLANAAAAASGGSILVTIAEGMTPPVWWDEILLQAMGTFDGSKEPRIANIREVFAGQVKGNGPVMHRAAYENTGRLAEPIASQAPGSFAFHGRVVVGMTTTPDRIGKLMPTLQTLFAQTLKADKIILSVPDVLARTGKKTAEIPAELSALEQAGKITLVRGGDYGPATKFVGALRQEKDPDAFLVWLDDDILYSPRLLEMLATTCPDGAAVGVCGFHFVPPLEYKIEQGHHAEAEILEGFGGVCCRIKDMPDPALWPAVTPEQYQAMDAKARAEFLADDFMVCRRLREKGARTLVTQTTELHRRNGLKIRVEGLGEDALQNCKDTGGNMAAYALLRQ